MFCWTTNTILCILFDDISGFYLDFVYSENYLAIFFYPQRAQFYSIAAVLVCKQTDRHNIKKKYKIYRDGILKEMTIINTEMPIKIYVCWEMYF